MYIYIYIYCIYYIFYLHIYLSIFLFIYLFIYLHILDEHIWLSSGGFKRLSGGWSAMCFLLHLHWLQREKIWLERQGSKTLQGPPHCSMIGYSDVQHTCFIFIFKSISNICIGKTEVWRELYLCCSKTFEWKSLKFKFHRFELLWADLNEY